MMGKRLCIFANENFSSQKSRFLDDIRSVERLEGAYHGLEEVSLTMIPRKKK